MPEDKQATQAGAENANEAGQTEAKTYTQEELDELLQKEGDRRVSAAEKKWHKDLEQQIQDAKNEGERLAKMTAKEKQDAERAKADRELAEAQAALNRERLEFQATKLLAEKGLPIDFAPHLVADDAEGTKAAIDAFEKAFKEAVQEAVTDKLKSNAPAAGGGASKMSRADINKMTDATERLKAIRENPTIFS